MRESDPLRPLGRALLDHHRGRRRGDLVVRFDSGEEDVFPVASFFREEGDLHAFDREGLARARGRVLDVGAGAGALALPLQRAGRSVTAIESLPEAVRVLRERGVEDVREVDVWHFAPEGSYDTVLALMNGSGFAGTLAGLPGLLRRVGGLLARGGVLLMDSTDLREPDAPDELQDGRYVGERQMQLVYGGRRGAPFPHLFVDPDRLSAAAREAGLQSRVLLREEDGGYLAELTVEEASGVD